MNFLLLIFLAVFQNVSCNGGRKTIRRNQTAHKCYSCNNLYHLKCLVDKIVENKERLYCTECTPVDPEFIINALDPEICSFLGKRGLKILHQNVNGIYGKLDSIKSFLSDIKNTAQIFCFSETHTDQTETYES